MIESGFKNRWNIRQFNELNQAKVDALDYSILFFSLFSILLVPGFHISSTFYLNLEEFILPIIGIRLLQKGFYWLDYYVLGLLLLGLIILISILFNPHLNQFGEYFEIYKLLKFVMIYIYSVYIFSNQMPTKSLTKIVSTLFIVLVIFNAIHYFDFFDFNKYITILYDSDGRDTMLFGKTSLGEPGPKRIVGTMGNPNMNAIVFLFFFSFFAFLMLENKKSKSIWKVQNPIWNYVLMMASAYLIILCQSRTALIVLALLFIIIWVLRIRNFKEILIEFSLIIGFYAMVFYSNPIGVDYIASTKIGVDEMDQNSSVEGRMKSWLYFIELWKSQPILGYGPNKQFIYSNNLHPESQYLFYLWRYGLGGILGILFLIYWPLAFAMKHIQQHLFLLMITVSVGLTSFMSNPIDNAKIAFLFAIGLGFSIALSYRIHKEQNSSLKSFKNE